MIARLSLARLCALAAAAVVLGACTVAVRSPLDAAPSPAAGVTAGPVPVSQPLPRATSAMPDFLRPLEAAPRGLEGRVYTDGSPEAADWVQSLDLMPPEFREILDGYLARSEMTVRVARMDDLRTLIPDYVHLLSDNRKRWGTYIADRTLAVALRRPDWSAEQETYTGQVTLLHEAFHVVDDAGKADSRSGYWYSEGPQVRRFVDRLPAAVTANQRALGTQPDGVASEILADAAALYVLNRRLPARDRAFAIGAGLTTQVSASDSDRIATGEAVEAFLTEWRRTAARERPSEP